MAQGDFTRINTNIGALNALNSLKNVQKQMGTAQLRLATGRRINEAADDPAGLTIATKFQYRASGLGVALDNIGDAKNMLAVAEGGLSKINDIMIKMRDKAEAAASDTLGTDERTAISAQLLDFGKEINNIVDTTQWNGKKLLNGLADFGANITFQVGADTQAADRIELAAGSFGSVDCTGLAMGAAADSATTSLVANNALKADAATGAVAGATLGGFSKLASGTYTVRVNMTAAATGTVQLLNSSGALVQVDNDGVEGGPIGYQTSFAGYATAGADGATTVNLGVGLTVALKAGLPAAGSFTSRITFQQSGDFSGAVDNTVSARATMDTLTNAIKTVSSRLQTVGSLVSRMNFREETLSIAKVNQEAAFSRIMNADMAFEQLESTKAGILQQTATAMLSQANQAPQGILSLFR